MSNLRSHFMTPSVLLVLLLLALSVRLIAQSTIQQSPQTVAVFRVAGTIVSATEGHPLSHARVSLQDVKNRQNQIYMITGDNGHFVFESVPAGKYSLTGAKRGYISAAYDEHEQFSTAIVTGAGLDTENLILRLQPTAVLTGHVLDELGEPVRNATITVWRDDHSGGISRTVRFRNEVSDDQGWFEFATLDAGTYFISVTAKPWYAVHPPSIHQTGEPEVTTLVDRVLPATIAVEAEKIVPGRFVQLPFVNLNVTASGEPLLGPIVARFRDLGFTCRFIENEQTLLWRKFCFLGPFALVTSASGMNKGEIYADAEWKRKLISAVAEACAVAKASGAEVDAAQIQGILDSSPSGMRSSMQKDLASRLQLELDAIGGSLVRGGERYGIDVTTTAALIAVIHAKATE